MMPGKGFAKGVERAGPDVAEHHADRADRKLQLAVDVMSVAVVARAGEGRSAARAGRHLFRLRSHGAALYTSPRKQNQLAYTDLQTSPPAAPPPSPGRTRRE